MNKDSFLLGVAYSALLQIQEGLIQGDKDNPLHLVNDAVKFLNSRLDEYLKQFAEDEKNGRIEA